MASFLDQAAAGGPLRIHGDGEQSRDFVHVEDAVDALVLVARLRAEGGRDAVWNVASGRAVTIRALADAVEAATARSLGRTSLPRRSGDVTRSLLSPARLRSAGWQPSIALDDGLRGLVAAHARPGDRHRLTRRGVARCGASARSWCVRAPVSTCSEGSERCFRAPNRALLRTTHGTVAVLRWRGSRTFPPLAGARRPGRFPTGKHPHASADPPRARPPSRPLVERVHEQAHPSRGGAAKPRDSLSSPGCRMENRIVILGRDPLGPRR